MDLKFIAAYASYGWHLFPMTHRTKKPKIKRWNAGGATQDIKTLTEWYSDSGKFKDCGVAVLTGAISNIAVLDIDKRNGGLSWLEEAEKTHPEAFQQAKTVQTGDGWHYYFSYNGEESKEIAPGVEIKSDGANITLPPTIHKSGSTYQWVT